MFWGYLLLLPTLVNCNPINRKAIVTHFNPTRNASSPTLDTSNPQSLSPLQIGNGDFAFSTDITSLQTLLPFSTMASWGWKNDTLPAGKTWADVENYKGVSWYNHGRLVQYDFGGDPAIEAWLRANPNRVNLGQIGLAFFDDSHQHGILNVSSADFKDATQTLDLWTGTLSSRFTFRGEEVSITTLVSSASSTVSITLSSPLLEKGTLGLFFDFPWNDGSAKFSAPFVGYLNETSMHTTTLTTSPSATFAQITHQMDAATFHTYIGSGGPSKFAIQRQSPLTHRYTLFPQPSGSTFAISVNYNLDAGLTASDVDSPKAVAASSAAGWEEFWTGSGFVDVMTGSTDTRAEELQRRIIFSRYLMRVNAAGTTPAQESGLVNNGWYGKFHMEEYFWHSMHWALWNNWPILSKSTPIYDSFLPTSIHRAQIQQGYPAGARWPKMTDPSGRSSPGDINNLLIWEQPHPLLFATYEYRAFPTRGTLEKWEGVVRETADWMGVFAWFNAGEDGGRYDLGPPMYVVSEDTSPNITVNPAFELAYWKFGLGLALDWMDKLGPNSSTDAANGSLTTGPALWRTVRENLAPLPTVPVQGPNGTETLYAVYEGIEPDFWSDPTYTSNHPALVGLHGWLPPTPGLDLTKARLTAEKVWASWNSTDFWGWDFPILAMSAARNQNPSKALDWLLHPLFAFDAVGMPVGGVQVPTPYFPGAGALLYAIGMMAAGWDGADGRAPGFPVEGWVVRAEGVAKAL